MFVITEADAAAIRTTFDQEGELSAAIELRRRFPAISDNMQARTWRLIHIYDQLDDAGKQELLRLAGELARTR
jgi:hypothetical protein